jgi:hypothetical protein
MFRLHNMSACVTVSMKFKFKVTFLLFHPTTQRYFLIYSHSLANNRTSVNLFY